MLKHKNGPPSEEQNQVERLGELCDDYDRHLNTVVGDHARGLSAAYDGYQQSVAGLNGQPFSSTAFERVLNNTVTAVTAQCGTTYTTVTQSIVWHEQRLNGNQSPEFQGALQMVTRAYMEHGIGSQQVQDVLKGIQSKDVRKAISYALIGPAWRVVEAAATRSEVGQRGTGLEEALKAAEKTTSKSGYAVIRAALDSLVREQLWQTVRTRGVFSSDVAHVKGFASGRAAERAMSAMLDRVSWYTAAYYHHHDPKPREVTNALDIVSSSLARGYMSAHLAEATTYTAPKGWEANAAKGPTEAQVAAGALTSQIGESDPKRDEARAIVAQAATRRVLSWLKGVPIEDVMRVVATVRAIRAKAPADKPASDRDVYLRYRRELEVGEGEQLSDADEARQERLDASFRILDALMGGPGGKIPF